jgi:hypothetical protein
MKAGDLRKGETMGRRTISTATRFAMLIPVSMAMLGLGVAGCIAKIEPRPDAAAPVSAAPTVHSTSLAASAVEEPAAEFVTPVAGRSFYVAPDGGPNGDGSKRRPWDIDTALAMPDAVKPGDTIWLRGGIYKGDSVQGGFLSKLRGAPGRPVTLRAFPGERATIDANSASGKRSLWIRGAWANYWGFEVTNSARGRQYHQGNLSADEREDKSNGIQVRAPNTKFINLIVHDTTGSGVGLWAQAVDAEVYGCLIYHNGISKFEHGIYTNGEIGTKKIMDNIIFENASLGITVHSGKNNPKGYDIVGNTIFNNGFIYGKGARNIDIGQGKSVERVTLRNNCTYQGLGATDVQLRYEATSRDIKIVNNYFPGAVRALGGAIDTPIGNDFKGTATANQVFIRPNRYEKGRANIAIYNWEKRNTVDVDVSSILSKGRPYEVRNAQDYFAAPVLRGTYDGKPLRLPMTGLSSAKPSPDCPIQPISTEPQFNVFVLLPR